MLHGLARFEERSSLRNLAVSRSSSTGRAPREGARHESVPVARRRAGGGRVPLRAVRSGAVPPEHWAEEAENRIDAVKTFRIAPGGTDSLPARQREVVLLREVESMTSAEVCEVLAISEANQRVLLPRGRKQAQAAA